MYLVWLSNIMRMNTLNRDQIYAKWLEQQQTITFTFNQFMSCGLFCLYILDWSIAMFYGNLGIKCKIIVDPDQKRNLGRVVFWNGTTWAELSWADFFGGRVVLGRLVFGPSCPEPVCNYLDKGEN